VDDENGPPALKSHATIDEEGMINVWVDLQKHLTNMPFDDDTKDHKERGVDQEGFDKCPPLNIVIFIVGSRGELLVARSKVRS
jgi:sterol 3beta-glucosyltransferase